MSFNETELATAHAVSRGNRHALSATAQAGCFHCGSIFRATDVRQWTDDGETAQCPACGVDAVVPEDRFPAAQPAFLAAMHARWFRHVATPTLSEWQDGLAMQRTGTGTG